MMRKPLLASRSATSGDTLTALPGREGSHAAGVHGSGAGAARLAISRCAPPRAAAHL